MKLPLKRMSPRGLELVAERFKALGEVSRLQIVEALQRGEKHVNELVSETGLGQPNVSRHLKILVGAGLIAKRKEGLNVYYRIADQMINDLCAAVCKTLPMHER